MWGQYELFGAESIASGGSSIPSSSHASIANRVSYVFDLRGPSIAIDTMCSSSLTAIHMACDAIRKGDIEAAVAGGVNLTIHPYKYLSLSQGRFMSSDGRCRSFGMGGDGYVPGEGVGAIVLKPLDDALRDGDHVYGIVRSSTLNHGGKTNGYTVPNPNAQAELIVDAITRAGVDPKTIGYIETHGTGTSLGDPIEITGLVKAFEALGGGAPDCPIGSVKSNIGHLEGAAGIAAVTKVLLQLRYGKRVPSIHADPPNPHIDFEHSRFRVQKELEDWPSTRGRPRRAGISSFGAGGSNAHLIIEDYPLPVSGEDTGDARTPQPELFLLSARDTAALRRYANIFADRLRHRANPALRDLAYTSQVGRTPMPVRLALIAQSIEELAANLDRWLASSDAVSAEEADIDGVFSGDAKTHFSRRAGGLVEGLEGKTFLDSLMENRSLSRLARLWVMGADIDWSRMQRSERPRRVSMPTYPFSRERYWIAPLPALHAREAARTESSVRAAAAVEGADRRLLYYVRRWAPSVLPLVDDQPVEAIPAVEGPLLIVDLQGDLADAMRAVEPVDATVYVAAGTGYVEAGPRSYQIDASAEEDFDRLVADLDVRDILPKTIVFRSASGIAAVDTSRPEPVPDSDVAAMLLLCKALARRKRRDFRLMFAFTTSEAGSAPSASAMAGFLNTLAIEQPGCLIKTLEIEVGAATSAPTDTWAALVLREMREDAWREREVRYSASLYGDALLRTSAELVHSRPESYAGKPPALRRNAVCLVSGGHGGLGMIFAEHLAREYQARIVLIGRSPPASQHLEAIARMRGYGAEVWSAQADLTNPEDTERVVTEARARYGRIDAVLHSAGTYNDATILNKTVEGFRAVASAKILGASNLDAATRADELDAFILFSSISGVTGNHGQCDYAYANRFLDAFAERRESWRKTGARRGKTLSIDWPYWQAGGMALTDDQILRQERHAGVSPLPTSEGIRAFESAMHGDVAQIAVLYGNQARIERHIFGAATDRLTDSGTVSADVGDTALQSRTEHYLKAVIGEEIRLSPERIDSNERLEAFGIDSVAINSINARLERDIGQLPRTLLYEQETISDLSRYLVRHARQSLVEMHLVGLHVGEASGEAAAYEAAPIPTSTGRVVSVGTEIPQVSGRIAIIGVHGRYPHSATIDEYWTNLREGRDLIDVVPAERWRSEDYYDPDPVASANGMIYCKWGGFIDDHDKFDANFFNIPDEEAAVIDPQERLMLESAWAAIEDAGYTRETLKRRYAKGRSADVGVFVGVTTNTYTLLATGGGDAMRASAMPWSIANRISYFFDFCGPSMPVDTACSSSLVALHLACESLRKGECQLAIAGGVNLYLHPAKYQSLCQRRMLSTDEKCRSYGADGDGFVPGEGVGTLLLKPLERAIADKDRIYGVVAGSAYDHSGRSNGYFAPNPNSQANLIDRTLREAGIHPDSIGYVEGHGTGTQLGDSLEIAALTQAFRKHTAKSGYCALGSVKANAGHSESAAGVAGITKILMQMRHRQLAPSLHATSPNPDIDFPTTPFRLQSGLSDWYAPEHDAPRRALINSFGAGGVNACAILEEYVPAVAEPRDGARTIFVLSAKSASRLLEYGRRMLAHLRESPDVDLGDLCYTMQTGREAMEERLAIVAASVDALVSSLESWIAGAETVGTYRGSVGDRRRKRASAIPPAMQEVMQEAFEAIAAGWVAGADVDWAALRSDSVFRKTHLPSYPFARTRHWLQPPTARAVPVATASRLHPLISYNTSTLREIRYASELSCEAFYAADHRIGDDPIFPGAGLLEMTCIAGNIAGERRVRRILDLAWVRPASFRRGDIVMRTVLSPVGNDADCTIFSYDEDNEAIVHCESRISFDPSPRSGDYGDPVAIPSLRERSLRVVHASEHYERSQRHGFRYGPTFRTVEEIHVGEDYALSKLRMSELSYADDAHYLLHPCMIDGALQTVSSLVDGIEPGARYLPFLLEETEIIHSIPRSCYAYVRFDRENNAAQSGVRKFDISILNENGTVLVALKRLYVRAMAGGTNLPSHEPRIGEQGAQLQAQESPST
jgi:polyketide synthase PksL